MGENSGEPLERMAKAIQMVVCMEYNQGMTRRRRPSSLVLPTPHPPCFEANTVRQSGPQMVPLINAQQLTGCKLQTTLYCG